MLGSHYRRGLSGEYLGHPPSYTYDYNGNELTKVVGSDTTSYARDYENRLTSVTLPGSGGMVTFVYDPFGRRIKKVTSTTTSVFAYDGDNLVEETNSSGTAVARYAQSLNIDEPLAMLRSSTTSYYQADGLGSVTSLSNTSGAIANSYTYDSFGKQTASTGSLVNPFRYTARESDTETGLYYYRARYYDESAGRFLSEDPIGFRGGYDFYRYVYNNPARSADPTGQSRCGRSTDSNGLPTVYRQTYRARKSVAKWRRPPRGRRLISCIANTDQLDAAAFRRSYRLGARFKYWDNRRVPRTGGNGTTLPFRITHR